MKKFKLKGQQLKDKIYREWVLRQLSFGIDMFLEDKPDIFINAFLSSRTKAIAWDLKNAKRRGIDPYSLWRFKPTSLDVSGKVASKDGDKTKG